MGALARRVPYTARMWKRNSATALENDMTEIEQRIESERERSRLLRRELECECPDACPVDHDN